MQIRRKLLRPLKFAAAAILATLAFAAVCNWWVDASAESAIFTDPNLIRPEKVGVVLGTEQFYRGSISPYYVNRIEAAARLYHAGKVSHLIVSGNPWQPQAMRASLMALGVPADRITLDPGGTRTLASIVRARDTFGQRSFVVISQADHCARAIYLARAYGCDAVGFAGPDPGYLRPRLREFLTRPKAVLDVYVLHRSAKAPGPKTPIPNL
jgi:SanA protein